MTAPKLLEGLLEAVRPSADGLVHFAWDKVADRPGCALLQSLFNASPGVSQCLHTHGGVTLDIGNMREYTCPPERFREVVERAVRTSHRRIT